jgi:hypothetical protein
MRFEEVPAHRGAVRSADHHVRMQCRRPIRSEGDVLGDEGPTPGRPASSAGSV